MGAAKRSVEVRAGLVLYGGSSLAVYMGGVSLEFLNAVRANSDAGSPYWELLEALDAEFQVDVISGTSAGGLNGAFLARALTTGGDLKHMSEMWRKVGDFGALTDWGPKTPTSLLNGDYFLEQLQTELAKVQPPAGGASPLVRALDLHLSATDIYGRYWKRQDALGSQILGRQHTKYFQLKYRPGRSADPDEALLAYSDLPENDFYGNDARGADGDKVARLAKLARTTAAFPAVFAPVEWNVKDTYSDEPGDTADARTKVWLSDGGILDNSPFGPALKTIYHRPATRPVDRKLFYVEPDPTDMAAPMDSRRDVEPNALRVAWAVVELRMYQGIDQHIRSLEQHNETVKQINQMVDTITDRLGQAEYSQQSHRDTPAGKAYRALRASQLAAQVRKALAETWLEYQAAHSEEQTLNPADWLPDLAHAEAKDAEAAWAYWDSFLDEGDTLLLKRRVHFLIEQIGRCQQGMASADPGLMRLETDLWKLLQALRRNEWQLWHNKIAPHRLYSLFDPTFAGDRKQSLLDAAKYLLSEFDREFEAKSLGALIADLHLQIPWERFEAYDVLLYPLSLGSSLGERDKVEWVRISPYDATSLLRPDPCSESKPSEAEVHAYGRAKMAGDAFFHFGGFLSHRWRANDFMWGRLDAADQMIRSLVKRVADSADEKRKQQIVATAQKARMEAYRQILTDELDADGRAKLALRVHRRLREMEELTRSLQAQSEPGTMSRTLVRLSRHWRAEGHTAEADAAQEAGERLIEAAAALQEAPAEMQSMLESVRIALRQMAATTMLPRYGTTGAEAAPDENWHPLLTKAWQDETILRHATWEEMRAYLLEDHNVGREDAASLHPAVLANTAVDMADNARRLVESIIGKAAWQMPAWVATAGKWLSGAVVRFRRLVKVLLPRPEAGADDRQTPGAVRQRNLLAAVVVIALSQNALAALFRLVDWSHPALAWAVTALIALGALRLLFPRKTAAIARVLPMAGLGMFGLVGLLGLAGESPTLAALTKDLTLWGAKAGDLLATMRAWAPTALYALAAYDFLLGLARWTTRRAPR